jgi:hypothetical protein
MAGVVVAPVRDHFERIDARALEEIFSEVSLDVDEVDRVIERVSATPVSEELF